MTPSDEELLQRFIELEEREGWWELEAYGQPYWHQIRFPLFGQIKQALGLMDRPQRSWRDRPLSSWLGNVRPAHWPLALRRSLWTDLEPADVLIVNHPRHVQHGEQWVCPYTQPLLDGFSPSYWLLEDVWQGVHSFPQPNDVRLKYLEWPFLLAQMGYLARHGLTGGRLHGGERATVRGLRQHLARELGGAPSNDQMLGMTRAAVREVAAFRGLYQRLLDRIQPKLVVLVVSYSYRCITLTAVARERGIPVVELQHGTMGGGHAAYNMKRHPPGFPDRLLTFGDWWRDITPDLPLSHEHAPAIGFAWLEQYLQRRKHTALGKRAVLFVSQGSIGEQLSRDAVELAKRAGDALDIRYKLHPGELLGWRERYPWLADAPFPVIDSATNIYDEMVRADVVVGVYSTAMFEAVAFDKPLVLAQLPGLEVMRPIIDMGAATVYAGTGELLRAVREADPPPQSAHEALWKPDAAQNFHRFITSMLS